MSFRNMFPWRKHKLADLVLVFNGWTDTAMRERFFGDIGHYDDEIRADRAFPAHPAGLLEINPQSGERPTPQNSRLRILYLPEQISKEDIIEYCRAIGLDVNPAC